MIYFSGYGPFLFVFVIWTYLSGGKVWSRYFTYITAISKYYLAVEYCLKTE